MAVLFAEELRRHGIEPLVYGLVPEVKEEFHLNTTNSIDDLLQDADLLVFGGGGAFLRSEATTFHSDLSHLHAKCRELGIPIMMISVGGDGGPIQGIPESRLRLLQDACFVSFRNPEDCQLRSAMKGRSEIHPDIVWSASDRLHIQRTNSTTSIVGVDDTLFERRSLRLFLQTLIKLSRFFHPSRRFVVFSSAHSSTLSCSEETRCYSEIRSFIEELSSFSILITPRLHAGLVTISLGVPVLLLAPHGKASLLFQRLNLQRYIFGGKLRAFVLAMRLLRNRGFEWCRAGFEAENFRDLAYQSQEHFSAMISEISRVQQLKKTDRHPDLN